MDSTIKFDSKTQREINNNFLEEFLTEFKGQNLCLKLNYFKFSTDFSADVLTGLEKFYLDNSKPDLFVAINNFSNNIDQPKLVKFFEKFTKRDKASFSLEIAGKRAI